MNRRLTWIFAVILLFSCNKEKKKNKQMAGDWEVKGYSEIIFDGTKNAYTVENGSFHFGNLNDNENAEFQIDFSAYSSFDTVEYHLTGTYSRQALDTVLLKTNSETYVFNLERQFKTDMNFQGGFVPNRKSVFILKQK